MGKGKRGEAKSKSTNQQISKSAMLLLTLSSPDLHHKSNISQPRQAFAPRRPPGFATDSTPHRRLRRRDCAAVRQLPVALCLTTSALTEREDLQHPDYLRWLHAHRSPLNRVDASLSLSYDLLGDDLQRRRAAPDVFPATSYRDTDPTCAAQLIQVCVEYEHESEHADGKPYANR